jgi:septum formation protein
MAISDKKIYLASRSPRRRELLHQIGVGHELLLLRDSTKRGADVDETPYGHEGPRDYAMRVAADKARAALYALSRRAGPAKPVLAADTTVALGQRIYGKPRNAANAEEILSELCGREHTVITAVTMGFEERIETRVSISTVKMKPQSAEAIRRYILTGEPMDKAGAYAVQGRAAAFITRIEGSYSGIMGLPLAETAELLALFGVEP